jgi:PAT family beta-lactamase induction signal transducer AmpG
VTSSPPPDREDGSAAEEDQTAPAAQAPAGLALSNCRWLRFSTLCSLYFAQGVPWGFVSIALIAALSERGATQQQTAALVALSLLPWTFKIVWGPIIDSFRLQSLGQRRPWIVIAQFMMAMTLLTAFSAADVTEEATLATLGLIFFTHNCFASLQDVATDAMAIDLLEESERGRVNGFMWASKLLGISVGGAGMATVIAHWSLDMGMRLMAAMILLIMLLPLLVSERPTDKRFPWSRGTAAAVARARAVRTGPIRVVRELFRAFGLRTTFMALGIAFVTLICEGLHVPVTAELFTQELGWGAEKYGHAQGIFGTIGKLLGALGGGFLCDRLGARPIVAVGAIVTTITFLGFSLTAGSWTAEGYPLVLYFVMLETGLALTTVSLFALFMKISWTTAAATQFTLYMTVLNIGNATGPMLTRLGLDYMDTYLLCAGLAVLPLAFLPLLNPAPVLQRKLQELAKAPEEAEEAPVSSAAVAAPGG